MKLPDYMYCAVCGKELNHINGRENQVCSLECYERFRREKE
ncbi:MAG: hypothetical protein ACFFG0_40305 [Candidatus Thorarchaeota archaeon]